MSTKTPPHRSFLWPHLIRYHEFKRRLGYTSFQNTFLARDLDQFAAYRGLASLDQFDDRFIFDWIYILSHRSARTKNKMLSYARGFVEYLLRQDFIRSDPTLRIPPIKFKAYKPHIYSIEEIHRLLQEAAKLKGPLGRTFPMLLLLIYACGLRIREALRLNIQDVDFEQNMLSLWNTKFHKERLAPFSFIMASKLKNYLDSRRTAFPAAMPHDPFFCHTHGVLSYTYVLTIFHQILRRCGLPKAGSPNPRLHDLRHTFAVHRLYKWYQEGHDILNKLPILSTYMGHISVEDTQVYLSVTRALLREGDKRFQRSFENLTQSSLKRLFKQL